MALHYVCKICGCGDKSSSSYVSVTKSRFVFVFLLLLSIFLLAIYICTWSSEAPIQGKFLSHTFNSSELSKVFKVDLEGEDVFVYLHIQKTGGATFGRHLVHDLAVNPPCQCVPRVKKCECFTNNERIWLFSRHSTGWVCGLHADWTELNDCVEAWFKKNDVKSRIKRRYHWLTFMREPVNRFLSEWQHVARGATWKSARLFCNGRSASLEEVSFCYESSDWSGVSFEDFISCKHNLAFNRMTRMLANLTKVNCYNRTNLEEGFVNETLLRSAKENLLEFSFFGLVEEQQKTQFLFERTFGLKFIDMFEQKAKTHLTRIVVTDDMRNQVRQSNTLDVSLYAFAKNLFLQRVKSMEARLGYTVEEYFSSIRDAKDENEGADMDSAFDDDDAAEDEGEERLFPSESSSKFIQDRNAILERTNNKQEGPLRVFKRTEELGIDSHDS